MRYEVNLTYVATRPTVVVAATTHLAGVPEAVE